MEAAVIALYLVVLTILGVYGFHRAHLVYLFWRHRNKRFEPPALWKELPEVTGPAADVQRAVRGRAPAR
jgi:hypothetical protein